MDKWNVAICDDNKAALGILSGAIAQAFLQHEVEAAVETFERPRDLVRRMQECAFSLLFLDIDMPGMDGITLSKQLRSEGSNVDIIYISNREDLVFDALRTSPKGFIRKSRFIQDVSGVIDAYFASCPEEKPATLVIQSRDQISYVLLNELLYIEGSGKNQLVHVAGREEPLTLHRKMQELEDELSSRGFLRIHKGYLVNYRFIRRIEDTDVLLTGGQKLPISRRKVQETKAAYMNLMISNGSMIL